MFTYYQIHWRRGISRLVYQKLVINVKPLVSVSAFRGRGFLGPTE